MKPLKNAIFFCTCAGLILTLSSCGDYSLMQKDRSDFLLEGQRLYYNSDDYLRTKSTYLEAYKSSNQEIKAQAAYSLAQIAKDAGQYDEHIFYLEKAFEYGYSGSEIGLAKAYATYRPTPENVQRAQAIFEENSGQSVTANIELAQLAIARRNLSQASQYAAQAERLFHLEPDIDGSNAVQMARLYAALPQGQKKTFDWYKDAKSKGNETAALELARLMMQPPYADAQSYRQGFNDLVQLAQKNNISAIKDIADMYNKSGQLDQSALWYRKLEALGDRDGSVALRLAKTYRKMDTPQDQQLMYAWYNKAIQKGNQKAADSLASYQAALAKKARLAAQKRAGGGGSGSIKESAALKEAYSYMEAGQKDKAYAVFKKLADQNNSLRGMVMVDSWSGEVSHNYASAYKNIGTEELYSIVKKQAKQVGGKYPEIANAGWMLAAEYGSGRAAYDLAKNLEAGSTGKSQQWYEKAANLGYGKAMLQVARTYAVNAGSGDASAKAFEWYQKAAEAGEAEGQYQLGLAYARGQGVTENLEKAKYWLNKAKDNGYELALYTLESIKN